MADLDAGHSQFGELAAGYALDALEPADEQLFLTHAEECTRCRALLAEFRRVSEALAEATPPAEPSSRLGDRIVAAALAADPQDDLAGGQVDGARPVPLADGVPGAPEAGPPQEAGPLPAVVPRHRRARRRWRAVAVAAAAVLVAAGGIWGGVTATGGPRPPLAACAQPHTCTRVVLTVTGTGRAAATVIVHGGVAWMKPAAAMAANPPGEIYVLWQITGSHTPLAVGSFDVRPGQHGPLRIGGLAVPYSGTWAFAVSLEHGRVIPAVPSRPVALGQVS